MFNFIKNYIKKIVEESKNGIVYMVPEELCVKLGNMESAFKKQIDNLKSIEQQAEVSIRIAQADIKSLQAENEMRMNLGLLRVNESTSMQEQIHKLEKTLKDVVDAIPEIHSDLESRIENLEGNVGELENNLDGIQSDVSDHDDDIRGIQKDIDVLPSYSQVEDMIGDCDLWKDMEKVEKQLDKLESMEKDIENLYKNDSDHVEYVQHIEELSNSMKQTLTTLSGQMECVLKKIETKPN